MSRARILLLTGGLLFAGCATSQPLPDQPGVVVAMERYYARHGMEDDARCPTPVMTVSNAEVVEQSGERMIVEANYRWEDRRRGSGVAQNCLGVGSRRFTLYQGQVMGMTGQRRSRFQPCSNRGP